MLSVARAFVCQIWLMLGKKREDINNNSVMVVITLLVVMTKVRENNRNVH